MIIAGSALRDHIDLGSTAEAEGGIVDICLYLEFLNHVEAWRKGLATGPEFRIDDTIQYGCVGSGP